MKVGVLGAMVGEIMPIVDSLKTSTNWSLKSTFLDLFSEARFKVVPAAIRIGFKSEMGDPVMMLPAIELTFLICFPETQKKYYFVHSSKG